MTPAKPGFLMQWLFTSENWFARWLRADFVEVPPRNPKIPKKVQERINRAEFDDVFCGKNPIPEYERIYRDLTGDVIGDAVVISDHDTK